MDINELLAKAFNISQDTKFLVRTYENKDLYTEKEMTYFELGSKLISGIDNVKRIDIRLNIIK